jgi:hypothetical protein
MILQLVATNSGWLIRQALKGITAGAAALSAYLTAKGVEAELTTAVTAGVVAGGSWLLETGLSFIARKYAVK